MTRQETFDTVTAALIKQGEPSIGLNAAGKYTCLYRGPHGRRCAVGHLLDDSIYQPNLEGCGVEGRVGALLRERGHDDELLARMQEDHDTAAEHDDERLRYRGAAWRARWFERTLATAKAFDLSSEAFKRLFRETYAETHGEHVSIEPDTDGLDMVRVVYRDDEDNTRAELTMSREVARAFFEEGLRLLDAGPLERRVTTLDERSKL